MSDHSAIYCQFRTKDIGTRIEVNNNITMKPSWKKASPQSRLNDLKITENVKTCCDVHCKQGDRNSASDDFLISILENVQDISKICLLSNRPFNEKKTPSIACWNTEVLPFKGNALFWHSIWESAGKPINTELHTILKRTRSIYHYQIRECKKMKQTLETNTLLAACLLGNGDLFKEIRKIRNSNPTLAYVIDGVYDEIPSYFAGIYSNLYNSCNDGKDIFLIYDQLKNRISFHSLNEIEKITPELVEEATNHLKCSTVKAILFLNLTLIV